MANFAREAARRVVEAARFVERQPRNRVNPGQGPRHVPYQKLAITTEAMRPRSGKTPGYGNCQPYLYNPATNLLVLNGDVTKVLNWTGSTPGPGIWIKYTVIDGYLWFDGNDCSGVAP